MAAFLADVLLYPLTNGQVRQYTLKEALKGCGSRGCRVVVTRDDVPHAQFFVVRQQLHATTVEMNIAVLERDDGQAGRLPQLRQSQYGGSAGLFGVGILDAT